MRLSLLFLALLSVGLGALHADISDRSVFLEGEDFRPGNGDWRVGDGWADDIYTATSGNAVLANDGGGKGEATAEVTVPAAGDYNVWVRYLKIGTYPGSFGLRIAQGGRNVFDQAYRTKPEGGDWRDIWEKFPAALEAGPATLALYIAQGGIRQRIDCVLLTSDLQYQPKYQDFAPQCFVRFRLLDPPVPVTATINTYLKRSPVYYYAPGRVTAQGLAVEGPEIAPGAWSPWFELSRFMDSGKWLTTVKFAYSSGGTKLERVKLDYQVAPTPDEAQAVTLHDDLDGHISTIIFPGNIQKYPELVELASAVTARHLRNAQELNLPPIPEMQMNLEAHICGFGDAYASTKMLAQEMQTARILGLNCFENMYGVRAKVGETVGVRRGFLSQWMPYQAFKCPNSPGLAKLMDDHFAKIAADVVKDDPQAFQRHARNVLWDEPGTADLKHLAECPDCLAAFQTFLTQHGLGPADFGKQTWAEMKPITREAATDAPGRKLYYWSIQFRDWSSAGMFRQATLAAEKHFGDRIVNMVNFTNGPLSGWGSGLIEGPDWFMMGRMGATSLLWSEDWATLGPEVSGYIVDMLRAAARPNKLPVGEYIIANHNPTLAQRTVSSLMHGAKTLHFYCYGPYYAFADGMISDNLETQRTLGHLTRFLAKADPYLYSAQVQPAQVAILYGKSHEIWQQDAAVGTERRSMYLALQHAHVPVDMLSEDDVAEGLLSGYKALYVTESNVRRDVAGKIAQWIRQGGVLQLCAGAGLRDEYDEPLGELTDLSGVAVTNVDRPGGDYREHYGIPHQQSRGEVAFNLTALNVSGSPAAIAFPVLGYQEAASAPSATVIASFADGAPAGFLSKAGKGTVIRYCFMPGLGYVKSANIKATDLITGYKQEQGWLLTLPVRLAGVVPPISVSEPLVQARLLRGPKADVLCLANWSGGTIDALTVTVRGMKPRKLLSAAGAVIQSQAVGRDLELRLPLKDVDAITLLK